MRTRGGRRVLVASAFLALVIGAYIAFNRPRSLEAIKADYYAQAATLASELESADDQRACEIVKELAKFGSLAKPAVPSILDCVEQLQSKDDTSAESAVSKILRELPDIGDRRFLPIYLELLENDDTSVSQRMNVWAQASQMGAAEIIEPMLRDLYDLFGDEIMFEAHMALRRIGRHDPEALLSAFTHSDPKIRDSALYAGWKLWLPEQKARNVIDKIFVLLEDGRHPAARELEYLAVSLTTNCEDTRVDEGMQYRAHQLSTQICCEWFSRYRGVSVEPCLLGSRSWPEEKALRDAIREAAEKALEDPTEIRRYLDREHTERAVNALQAYADREVAIREIRALLQHENNYLVMRCIDALGAMKAEEAVDELLQIAEGKQRNFVIRALTAIGDPRAYSLFRSAIEEKDCAMDAALGLAAVAERQNHRELSQLALKKASIPAAARLCLLVYLDSYGSRSYRTSINRLSALIPEHERLITGRALSVIPEGEDGVEYLRSLLTERNDRTASLAVEPLITRLGNGAAPILRAIIPSAGPRTTLEIINRLEWIDTPESIDTLIAILEEGDGQYPPQFQLYLLTGEKYGEIAEAWRAWYREERSSR